MQRVTELRKSDEDSFLGGGNSRATKADRDKWHQSFMSSISKRNSLVQESVGNPILMRGSLNQNKRKVEMDRINKGNIKMLEKLSNVKPAVGNLDQWRRHESRTKSIKKITAG